VFTACSGGDYERQLERFEEMNRTDVPLCVDSVQPLVRHYDHWWHSRNHRMRAYYMMGCAYRDQGSAPRALENYQRAVNIADTTDARCDLNVLMRIHSQMSQIFLLQRLPEQEEQELRIAEHLAWQIGDTLSALIFESHICSVLYNKGNYKECINRTSRFHENYSSWGFYNELKLFSVDCVKSYLALKDYVNAKKYLDYYESCPYFKTHPEKITGGIGALFVFKGQYHLGIQKIDSSEYYFKKALPYKHLGDNEMLTYEGLYKTYSLSQKVDSVLKYTSLYSDALTHSFNKAQSEATIQTKSLYDYSIEQQEAKEQTQRASRLTKLLVIAVMLIVLLSVLYLYRNERRKREIS
jgi:tetratricopeptide (TPR) repeat protein